MSVVDNTGAKFGLGIPIARQSDDAQGPLMLLKIDARRVGHFSVSIICL